MIKILTVDDEIDICEHIKDVFSRLGYEVLIDPVSGRSVGVGLKVRVIS